MYMTPPPKKKPHFYFAFKILKRNSIWTFLIANIKVFFLIK